MRGLLVAEGKNLLGLLNRQATNLINDQAGLLRRNARTHQLCCSFHNRQNPCLPGLAVTAVTPESSGWRKLAQLVPHHVLVDQDRHVLSSVMHGNSQADHLGQNRSEERRVGTAWS